MRTVKNCSVLNLVISGIPSILCQIYLPAFYLLVVLNLVISGIPSILAGFCFGFRFATGFKPCYKWNTFNTRLESL